MGSAWFEPTTSNAPWRMDGGWVENIFSLGSIPIVYRPHWLFELLFLLPTYWPTPTSPYLPNNHLHASTYLIWSHIVIPIYFLQDSLPRWDSMWTLGWGLPQLHNVKMWHLQLQKCNPMCHLWLERITWLLVQMTTSLML